MGKAAVLRNWGCGGVQFFALAQACPFDLHGGQDMDELSRFSWLQICCLHKPWLLLRLLCAFIWGLALYWVQSLPFEVVPFVQHAVIVRCLRLFLNLLFA